MFQNEGNKVILQRAADKEQSVREDTLSRSSNVELLRIVCILAIIAHHFSIFPNWDFDYNTITFNRVFLQTLCIGGKLGVNCFLLISGYFLIGQKKRSLESILKIWLQMFFYSVFIPLSFCLFGKQEINAQTLILSIIPVTGQIWNYASSYFVLMLFVSFYNRFLQGLSKNEFQKLLWCFFCCWCFVPTITGRSFESNYLIWMFVAYAIGAYIRLYPNKLTEAVKPALTGVAASFTLYVLSVIVLDVLGTHFLFLANNAREIRFGQMQMFPCVMMSISLFLLFKNLHIKSSRTINFLAKGVYGVYLIHEHPLIRELLWNQWFQNTKHYKDQLLFLYVLFVVIIVFFFCETAEQLRICLLEKNYMPGIQRLCAWIKSRKNR